jgi:hypothetical protein
MQFPALGVTDKKEDGFGHMEDIGDNQDTMEDSDNMESLKKQVSDMNLIKQQLVETKAKLRLEEKTARTAMLKLEHVEKVASQRIVESMTGANFEDDSNHLAMLLATVLDKDDFEYDKDSDKVEPKAENEFLKRIEENCANLSDKDEKLTMVRNKVLDKMKRTHRRERLSSRGSVCSIDSRTSSRTRLRSKEDDSENDRATKQIKQQSLSKPVRQQSRLPAPVSHQP